MTLKIQRTGAMLTAVLDRPAQRNAIDAAMLAALGRVLDEAEADPDCRAVVLAGADGVFCTGMDFAEAADAGGPAGFEQQASAYVALLRRLGTVRVVTVASVDGVAAGGGVGLAAACDLVVATPRASFALPEALWGLLPGCVLPWLVRRTGFQAAYRMALTTQVIGAADAQACQLADAVSERPAEAVRKLLLRTLRADPEVVAGLKDMMRTLQAISPETERQAVAALCRLVARPQTRAAITAYVERGVFPWESRPEGQPHA